MAEFTEHATRLERCRINEEAWNGKHRELATETNIANIAHAMLAAYDEGKADTAARVAELEKLNDALMDGDIKRVCIESGITDMDITGGMAVKMLAHITGGFLRGQGGTNFVTVDVTDRSDEENPLFLSVTVQRKQRKSPADRIGELEEAVAMLARFGWQGAVTAARKAYGDNPWLFVPDYILNNPTTHVAMVAAIGVK